MSVAVLSFTCFIHSQDTGRWKSLTDFWLGPTAANVLAVAVQEPLERKMEIIATRIYGAQGIELAAEARKKLELYMKQVRVNV